MGFRRQKFFAVFGTGALLASALWLGGETPPPGKADPVVDEIQQQCDDRVQALGTFFQETKNKVLDKFKERDAALEEASKKEPALAGAATGVSSAQVLKEAREAVDSVRLKVELGESVRDQAVQAFAVATKEPDPVRKVEALKKAVTLMLKSEEIARDVAVEIRPVRHQHTFNSEAFNRLEVMAQTLTKALPDSQLGVLNHNWDAAAKHASETLVGQNTHYFGVPVAYGDGSVTLQNGRKINTKPLEAAATSGQQARPREPLFRPVPVPAGSSYMMVNPGVRNQALSAATDPKVGGVALKVTLLALSVAGVPGFTQDGVIEGVDQTAVLSLKRLLKRVQPAAGDPQRWAALPDELRFPGGIERVLGYVLDRERGDVILIGVPALRPEARMDLDTIILGLRASWRDDALVFVSLDPVPLEPWGPQLSRVGGVPADSVVAKFMLDADYMMKEIMIAQRPTDVASYRTTVQIMKSDPTTLSRNFNARFWFYPKPICPTVSGSGRTVLFNAELQILTEQMAMQGGIRVGTGAAGGVETTSAFEFTRELDSFAGSAKVDPQANFTRLRGLTGVVTLGTMLHKAGVDYPVLRDFTSLPWRHLTGAAAVRKQYPGLVTRFEVSGPNGPVRFSIGGGVELLPRPRRSVKESGVELLATKLERAIDRGDLLDLDSARESIPLVFTRTDAQTFNGEVDALLVKGTTAFAKGQYEAAAQHFRAATAVDPMAVDAYINLAFSLDRLGRENEARAAIRTARLLDPDDQMARMIEFAIRYEDERSFELLDSTKTWRKLSNLYTANARTALYLNNNNALAYAWANDAIKFKRGPTAVEAHLIRGFASMENDLEKAREDIHLAWDETRYVLNGGALDNDEQLYALACMGLSECEELRVIHALKSVKPGPELFRSLAADLQEGIKLMGPAQKMCPDLSLIFTITLGLEGKRYLLLKPLSTAEGQRAEAARLAALAEDILKRFPDSTDAYRSTAELYLKLENPERAAAICSRWLAGHPLDTDCLTQRATAFAVLGKCAEARQDLSIARKDPQFKGLPPEFKSACGDL